MQRRGGKWQKTQNAVEMKARVGKQLSWQGWTVAGIKVEPKEENVEAVNVAVARLVIRGMGKPCRKSEV